MRKRKFISFLLIVGLGSILFGLYWQVTAAELSDMAPLATPSLNAMGQQVQEPSPEPTDNLDATIQALVGQAQSAEATSIAANAEVEKQKNHALSIQATESASVREHQARMKELENEQIALDNENLILSNQNQTLVNENLALENESKALNLEEIELENESKQILGTTITLLTTVISFFVVGLYLVKRHHEIKAAKNRNAAPGNVVVRASPSPDKSLADELSLVPIPQTVIQVAENHAGVLRVNLDDWTGIATLEQLLAVARGVRNGTSLAIANWYGDKKPFTRSEYENFIEHITIKGIGPERRVLAWKVNGHAVLKEYGQDYFDKLLEKHG